MIAKGVGHDGFYQHRLPANHQQTNTYHCHIFDVNCAVWQTIYHQGLRVIEHIAFNHYFLGDARMGGLGQLSISPIKANSGGALFNGDYFMVGGSAN